jgi:hypothetical protein
MPYVFSSLALEAVHDETYLGLFLYFYSVLQKLQKIVIYKIYSGVVLNRRRAVTSLLKIMPYLGLAAASERSKEIGMQVDSCLPPFYG